MSPDLPSELKAALDRKIEGLSRNDAAQRASGISRAYRGGGNSTVITTANDALAYALARMPATYAACTASLGAIVELRPDFAPGSLIDVGAGPGTASWAAAQQFPSLTDFAMLDANASLRDLALDLAHASDRLASAVYRHGDAIRILADAPMADLVIASYIVAEIDSAERLSLADAMWGLTREMLVIVEPGTPDGHTRILQMRARLVSRGAYVVAPCPHERACPVSSPDWCHFSQRLARSRAHMHLKNANVPYEDEKYSYVVLTRVPPAMRGARVLAQPKVTKVSVTAKLCTADGLQMADVPHREKTGYARARKWAWGDALLR